jgi:hypothetical protein
MIVNGLHTSDRNVFFNQTFQGDNISDKGVANILVERL